MINRIGIWSKTVEFQTYAIAKAALFRGFSVDIVTKPKNEGNHYGHTFYYEKLEKLEGVRVLQKFEPIPLSWLYIQASQKQKRLTEELVDWSHHAQHIGIFSTCGQQSHRKMLLSQVKEILRYFPLSIKAERVLLSDVIYQSDIYALWATRHRVGIDVHSNFLDNSSLSAKLFARDWEIDATRKYYFNFIGNRHPEPRTQIIQTINAYLSSHSDLSKDEYLWIEYGDEPGQVRGVAPAKFVDYLSESNFTLCPPGYSRITHRVVEALVRGSIPVLHADELELYDLNLQDQINCLAVDDKGWIEAVKRIVNMPQSKIIEIRSNIVAMQEKYLTAKSYSSCLSVKMGLTDEPQS